MINKKTTAISSNPKQIDKVELGTVFHFESKYKDMSKLTNIIAELIFSHLKTELSST